MGWKITAFGIVHPKFSKIVHKPSTCQELKCFIHTYMFTILRLLTFGDLKWALISTRKNRELPLIMRIDVTSMRIMHILKQRVYNTHTSTNKHIHNQTHTYTYVIAQIHIAFVKEAKVENLLREVCVVLMCILFYKQESLLV